MKKLNIIAALAAGLPNRSGSRTVRKALHAVERTNKAVVPDYNAHQLSEKKRIQAAIQLKAAEFRCRSDISVVGSLEAAICWARRDRDLGRQFPNIHNQAPNIAAARKAYDRRRRLLQKESLSPLLQFFQQLYR